MSNNKDIEMLNPFANSNWRDIKEPIIGQPAAKTVVVTGGRNALVTAMIAKIEHSNRLTIIKVST
ncbi:MAG: hypothetical protein J6N72_04885 [Psychrobacter sp.]|nr:hypothetical protein [Psychrobacter sp.]